MQTNVAVAGRQMPDKSPSITAYEPAHATGVAVGRFKIKSDEIFHSLRYVEKIDSIVA